MAEFLPGFIASVLAYFSNRLFIKRFGNMAIITFIPFWQEFLKSVVPILLGTPLIFSHLVFGAMEAIYEIGTAENARAAAAGGFVSFVSHLIFGILTVHVYYITKSLLLSVFAVSLLHGLWNYIIYKIYTC